MKIINNKLKPLLTHTTPSYHLLTPKRYISLQANGLTLIELLVAIAIAGMITGIAFLFLNNGLEGWRLSRGQLALNKHAEKIMEVLDDGGFRSRGIRDALEITSAGSASLTIVPIWRDTTHKYINKNEFKLDKPYEKDSPIPVALVKKPGSGQYLPANIKFYEDNDTVKFMEKVPSDSELMFIYHPDPVDPGVSMTFEWDPASMRLKRIYNRIAADLIGDDADIRVTSFEFSYFDNLGRELKIDDTTGKLSAYQMKAVSAIKTSFTLKKEDNFFDAVSVTGIRNRKGAERGISLQEGSVIRIPNSLNIVSLGVNNIEAVKPGGRMDITITGDKGNTWALKLYFGRDGKTEEIKRYEVEYPKGAVVYSSDEAIRLNVGRLSGKGIDLLSLDDTGDYDYDNDRNLEDTVIFDDRSVTLEVTRMDCERAVLFVRP